MRLKPTFKTLLLAATASFCVVVYNVTSTHREIRKPHGRAAHITAKDLLAIGHSAGDGIVIQPADLISSTSPHALNASLPAPSLQQAPNKLQEATAPHAGSTKAALRQVKGTVPPCDEECRQNRLRRLKMNQKSIYAAKVQVENVTLPGSWTVTRELVDRLSERQRHVQETCKKYGLDKASKAYQPNAWEFLINKEHNLVWCNVFKAASSTWFYNFNLLAGYSEYELLHTKESPVTLARKRYSRPTVDELQRSLNTSDPPLSFMIVRHPFERLVSGYRDKILSGNRYYSKLSRSVAKNYRGIAPPAESRNWPRFGSMVVASFPQFVQFLLDETATGNKLDEHWTPMTPFCTPCLVPFDVFAKVETLQEDGNYIIFSSGIKNIIKPKLINRSRSGPTEEVADKFLCQLTKGQMEGLINMYKLDLELFQYDVSKYRACAQDSPKPGPSSSKVV